MTELLRKWAELEPERCGWNMADGYTVLLNGKRHRRLPHGDALLLAAVIEAIEAHDEWRWRLGGPHGEPDGKAYVLTARYVEFVGAGSTPAAALLTAYLAALEAEAGR